MTTAFVLTGGGSLGAVQVGMLQVLAERDVRPDLLVGTSVGALNAAFVAGRGFSTGTVDELGAIWRSVRRVDVFPFQRFRHLRSTHGAALCSPVGLRRLLTAELGMARLEEARVPVHVTATDVLSGEEVLLSRGDAVSAVLASAAIPAVFPPVEIDGALLYDGGLADNAPISKAVALGATRVFVLPTGYACALSEPPRSVLAHALHALTLLIERRLILDVARYADVVDVAVLPPLCPLTVGPGDFRHTGELIDRARTATRTWLDEGGATVAHPERFLSLHGHAQESPPQPDGAMPEACPPEPGTRGASHVHP
jgi:NTE family protein